MLPSACTLLLPLGQVVLIFLQMAALLPFSRDVCQALALPGPTLSLGALTAVCLSGAALLPFSGDVFQALALPGPTLSPGALTAQFASPVLMDYTKTGQHTGQDRHWVLILALPLTDWVIMGKFSDLSVPQFPHL